MKRWIAQGPASSAVPALLDQKQSAVRSADK